MSPKADGSEGLPFHKDKLRELSQILSPPNLWSSTIDKRLYPYFLYIEEAFQRSIGFYAELQGADEFLVLFIAVAKHFSNANSSSSLTFYGDSDVAPDNIKRFADALATRIDIHGCVHDQPCRIEDRNIKYTDDVMLQIVLQLIGMWLLIEPTFKMTDEPGGSAWMRAYSRLHPDEQEAVRKGDIGLQQLLNDGLLPIAERRPRGRIPRKELNALTVTKFGRIRLEWTVDISQHLTIVDEPRTGPQLMLFKLPCILNRVSRVDSR